MNKHNWNEYEHFSKDGDEWSEDPDRYASGLLLKSVDNYRHLLGFPVHPSPVAGALARFDDDEDASRTSQHYVGGTRNRRIPIKRRSTALDVFTTANICEAFMVALSSKLFGGVGVYFDTKYRNKRWCMLHLDLRIADSTAVWFRHEGKYYYPMKSNICMKLFFKLLYENE